MATTTTVCFALSIERGKGWNAVDCGQKKAFVCEKLIMTCPPLFIRHHSGWCYWMTPAIVEFKQAEALCKVRGGRVLESLWNWADIELENETSKVRLEYANDPTYDPFVGIVYDPEKKWSAFKHASDDN